MSLGLSQPACAKALGVCLRTVRHWDRGRNRVPWSAVRLLRLLRDGDLGELSPRWTGWRLLGDRLVTPAGVTFGAHEFTWWALTCLQARSWQRAHDRATARPSAGDGLHAGVPVVDGGALDLVPVEAGAPVAADTATDGAAASPPLADPLCRENAKRRRATARSRALAREAPGSTGLVLLKTSGTRRVGRRRVKLAEGHHGR